MTSWRSVARRIVDGMPLIVAVDVPRGRTRVGEDVESALIDASREALRNVVRHTDCDRAELSIHLRDDTVEVVVSDDGPGLPDDEKWGFGIRWSIMDRMEGVGGRAEVVSQPSGTQVLLTVQRAGNRRRMTLEESFVRTLQVPGEHRARLLALRVAVPTVAVNSWVGVRHGMLDRGGGLQILCWLVVLVAGWWFVARLDRGAPAPASFVLLVITNAIALAAAMATLDPGDLPTFASWMILAFSIPLVVLAYVTPLRLAAGYVLPNLVVVFLYVWHDPTTTVVSAFGAITTPLVPLMAGVLGHLQRRAVARLDSDVRRLERGRAGEESAAGERDALLMRLEATVGSVEPYFEGIARGDLDTARDDVRLELAALAHSLRDELYVPGLFDDDLRGTVRSYREAGGKLTIRPDDGLHSTPELVTTLRGLLESTSPSAITVSRHDRHATRIVVVPGLAPDSLDALGDAPVVGLHDVSATVLDLVDVAHEVPD